MLDLIAAITSDPTAIPLFGVLAFAAGMYPIGLMLGSACCCGTCSPPCESCEGNGALPDTITVTFDGYLDEVEGPKLCKISFYSPCFGSGGAGVATAPYGAPELAKGPLSGVSITNGGTGYALLGRVQPTLTASTDGGSGAEFTITLSKAVNNCKVDYWKVSSVTASGGTGYYDGQPLLITVAEGDTVETHAQIQLQTTRSVPSVSLSVNSSDGNGSGADLQAVFGLAAGSPSTWPIASVTVNDGGALYTTKDTITITAGNDTIVTKSASLKVNVTHAEPTVTTYVYIERQTLDAPDGASLTANLSPATSYLDGSNVWAVSSVTINSPGAGYQPYDLVVIPVNDGSSQSLQASAIVSEVDEDGGILSVAIIYGGEYFKGAPISGVTVLSGGAYYKPDNVVSHANLISGGIYYRESKNATPYVADVTVILNQTFPSQGSGAVLVPVIDDSPTSPTFGKIIDLTIEDGGDGYLAWQYVRKDCCGHQLNGKPIVLRRRTDDLAYGLCKYEKLICGGYDWPFAGTDPDTGLKAGGGYLGISVRFNGIGNPATATANTVNDKEDRLGLACQGSWSSPSPIASCDNFSWTATNAQGVSITVEPGGGYDPEHMFRDDGQSCSVCCQGADSIPEEIVVELEDIFEPPEGEDFTIAPLPPGTYVLSNLGNADNQLWINLLPDWPGIGVSGLIVGINTGFQDSEFSLNPPLPVWPGEPEGCQYQPCNACLKKCIVTAALNGLPAYMPWVDTRLLCSPLFGGPGCGDCSICEPTPICSPSGRVIEIAYGSYYGAPPVLRLTVL